MKVLHVVGARPNFMKAAPVLRAAEKYGAEQILVHTGQHYDENMSQVFFDELNIPRPHINLDVGSASHAAQTGQVMIEIEPVLTEHEPDVVLVYGDVNSTAAAAMVASKLPPHVGHVEAGLRSYDRTMPEEINRVVTDHIADFLFTPSRQGGENLRAEGIAGEKIHFVGNVMIDTLVRLLPRAREREILGTLGLERGEYVLVTLHRPSNVDEPGRLGKLVRTLERIGGETPVILPAHPRTTGRLHEFGIDVDEGRLRVIEPVGYLDFLGLQSGAGAVITDSGGIQEETTYLGVPCFTVRPNTERPVTIQQGTNTLVGSRVEELEQLVRDALNTHVESHEPPEYWDGRASHRIAAILSDAFD